MKLKTIIIEDEAILRRSLVQKLERFCGEKVEIVSAIGSIHEAVLYLNSNPVDLAIVDIRLSDGISFDIFSQLQKIDFKVIFVTAYDEFAIRAIKLGALDYLLKPIKISELKESVTKAYENQLEENLVKEQAHYLKHQGKQEHIIVKSAAEYQLVKLNEIIYANSDKGYTTFYLDDHSKIISTTHIGEYEKILPTSFIRTHQSYIVNTAFVFKYLKEGTLVLKKDIKIPVSVRKREEVLKRIFQES